MLLKNLKSVQNLYNETHFQVKKIEFKIFDYRIFKNEHNDK